ncbi:MAG: glycosyltransferase family 2 protein [Chthoniobacteraceae bacterium]|jgi:glycosyltransferase involved in cell wall biosynthesis
MKIRSICLTKNEADVIEPCLHEAARWSDRIYVYDGASTDGTWEKVLAMKSDRIIPWKSDGAVFREGLRAEVFAAFRNEAAPGDWWCQLNADEFYVQPPDAFLRAVPSRDHVVWAVNIQYYITEKEIASSVLTGSFIENRPNLLYYKAACAEPRFFRHRARLRWSLRDAWPAHLGVTHPHPLYFRHYPYRSPRQIQTRLDTRRDNRSRGFEGWDHASEDTWQKMIAPSADLHRDESDGHLIVEDEILRQPLDPAPRRIIKRLLHSTGIWP